MAAPDEALQNSAEERVNDHIAASDNALRRHVYSSWEWCRGGSRHSVRVTNGVRFEYQGGRARVLAMELHESGGVMVAAGGLVNHGGSSTWQDDRSVLDQVKVVTITVHTIGLIAEVADRLGFRGSIGLGLALDGVKGAWPELRVGPQIANTMQWIHARDQLAPFHDSGYRKVTMATVRRTREQAHSDH